MQTKRKKQTQSDWRFALEQIGQELRECYPAPENMSPELSTMLTLNRQIETTKQGLTEAQSESRKLVAHIKELLARGGYRHRLDTR
jgi:hypothetical protein